MGDVQHSFQYFASLRNRSIIPLLTSSGTLPSEPNLPDPNNVQGDIIYQFPKLAEAFIFFRISDVAQFKIALASFHPTPGSQVFNNLSAIRSAKLASGVQRTQIIKIVQTQIAFTRAGLNLLGQREPIGDDRFDTFCMRDNKTYLGDGMPWDSVFDKPNSDPVHGTANEDAGAIHCVVSIAANDVQECQTEIEAFKIKFKGAINANEITVIQGKARPNDQKGHEHFGYMDGISQPAMRGIIVPNPGQIQVDPGVIITGYEGDPMLKKRPDWAKDGTFMVFRKLQQLVPEFHKYLNDNGPRWKEFVPKVDTTKQLTDKEGAELWGARIVGRWPSGAPIAKAPVFDDPAMAKDPKRNNDFNYTIPGIDFPTDKHCPFTAHTRKTAPRDLDPFLAKKFLEGGSIIRAGIPFGDEVSPDEEKKQTTDPDPNHWRGLLFVAYQSDLNSGFVRQTVQYANNDYFPSVSFIPDVHGQDPILGGPPHPLSDPVKINEKHPVESGDQVDLQFLNENGDTLEVKGFATVARRGAQPPPGIPQQFFVNSRGGEYFFVPSIKTLKALATGVI
ncbi:uncharacterized protein FIBRA_07737 [Fibroporia radiculosa]|uniref:DyP dimeric alpha+beta barrel domain-containing protein n=1 Tax=Fibroporia radiculosa TaxID=599839 RepID=J4I191_9APHY|nr:uncharacterized protein FIBRA_07737 [Fibroporia radiculosa]CCM05512.1 predicted protein [Fibroporia radiculosa]